MRSSTGRNSFDDTQMSGPKSFPLAAGMIALTS